MKELVINIKPLSVNNAWQGRRFKTGNYKKWQEDFKLLIKDTGEVIEGKIAIHCDFYIKNDKRSDIDNFLKPLLDTLKDCGVIKDDRYIYKIIVNKFKSNKEFIKIKIQKLC